ncbi:hypothetical protein ACLOJK_031767 [Asimina triloba]
MRHDLSSGAPLSIGRERGELCWLSDDGLLNLGFFAIGCLKFHPSCILCSWTSFSFLPTRRSLNSLAFATVSADDISGSQPAEVQNLGHHCVVIHKVHRVYRFWMTVNVNFDEAGHIIVWSFLTNFGLNRPDQAIYEQVDEKAWHWHIAPSSVQDYESCPGKWKGSSTCSTILDPLNGEPFIKLADVPEMGIKPFVESLSMCPKHGLHNPFRSQERRPRIVAAFTQDLCIMFGRYILFGDVSAKAAYMLSRPEVSNFFTRLIQRVSPKSYHQAEGEVYVSQKFLENFSGDQEFSEKFLFGSLQGLLEYPEIILGSKVKVSVGLLVHIGDIIHVSISLISDNYSDADIRNTDLHESQSPLAHSILTKEMVSIVMEQMLRLLHSCGLPVEDVDFINTDGLTMNKLLLEASCAKPRMLLFTGSSRVAEKLAVESKGRIKLEDAGFDWKILGPDVHKVDYVAWVCDQDAYACSGQKCSAQSLLFMHENWGSSELLLKMKALAARRKLEDLTVGPVLTKLLRKCASYGGFKRGEKKKMKIARRGRKVTTASMLEHVSKLLLIPGSKLLFGGEPLQNHSIPDIYGAIKPTAIFVPLDEILKDENFELVTKEIFGPFQVVTEYKQDQLDMVLDVCARMHAHLTAAVVSNDPLFLQATQHLASGDKVPVIADDKWVTHILDGPRLRKSRYEYELEQQELHKTIGLDQLATRWLLGLEPQKQLSWFGHATERSYTTLVLCPRIGKSHRQPNQMLQLSIVEEGQDSGVDIHLSRAAT